MIVLKYDKFPVCWKSGLGERKVQNMLLIGQLGMVGKARTFIRGILDVF